MIEIGGIRADKCGVCTLSDFSAQRFDHLDDIEQKAGKSLEQLRGQQLESVLVVKDARHEDSEGWDFDEPVILRFKNLDVAIESVSGMHLSIAFGTAPPAGSPLRLFPSDGGENDVMNSWFDLSWMEYEPLKCVFGETIESLYWRADVQFHPLALGIRFRNGHHLRIGDGADITVPEIVDPLAAQEATEFDKVILPVGYRKPATSVPRVSRADFLMIPGRDEGIWFLELDASLWDCYAEPVSYSESAAFIGGLELKCGIPFLDPGPARMNVVAIFARPEDIPDGFFEGNCFQFVKAWSARTGGGTT